VIASPGFRRQRWRNWLHGLLLLGAMGALVFVAGAIFGGPVTGLLALAAAFIAMSAPSVGGAVLVLRMHRASPLDPTRSPAIYAYAEALAQRAGMPATPRLFVIPSATANAFAVGSAREPAIALSHGLLRRLDEAEIVGVLAHETSHLRHDDVRLMALAAAFGRLSALAVNVLVVLVLLQLPLLLMGAVTIPLQVLVVLMALPVVQGLLQLAFSRSREYAADLSAAELLGDPEPLARALIRLEELQRPFWWPLAPRRIPEDTDHDGVDGWLRTHPATAERVRRLRSLANSDTVRRRPPLVIKHRWPDRWRFGHPRRLLRWLPPWFW
jgi:heat shock protein HtpX